MKTAIVYYSLEGNTKYIAEMMGEALEGDLIALEPVKPYPVKGFAKFYHGGKAATFGEKPELKPYTFCAGNYDHVILAGPVWASKPAPPVNTFLAEHGEALKALGAEHISIVLCQSGKGAEKVVERYEKMLKVAQLSSVLVLIDPLKKSDSQGKTREAVIGFCESIRKKVFFSFSILFMMIL